jgi:hypothetical protein
VKSAQMFLPIGAGRMAESETAQLDMAGETG